VRQNDASYFYMFHGGKISYSAPFRRIERRNFFEVKLRFSFVEWSAAVRTVKDESDFDGVLKNNNSSLTKRPKASRYPKRPTAREDDSLKGQQL
jgi:hypothetical protein